MKGPKIIEKDAFFLAGMNFFGDPFINSEPWSEQNAIGKLWQRFIAYIKENKKFMQSVTQPDVAMEVHLTTSESIESGNFAIMVGCEVDIKRSVPIDLVLRSFPKSEYAVFTLKGEEISSDWGYEIYEKWLPSTEFENGGDYGIQYYDKRFKGLDNPESEIDVWVPIKLKESSD